MQHKFQSEFQIVPSIDFGPLSFENDIPGREMTREAFTAAGVTGKQALL
jgi:hypothetical protein